MTAHSGVDKLTGKRQSRWMPHILHYREHLLCCWKRDGQSNKSSWVLLHWQCVHCKDDSGYDETISAEQAELGVSPMKRSSRTAHHNKTQKALII